MTGKKPIISCRNVTKEYRNEEVIKALDNISFEVYEGDMFCLVGPNGAGKTTLIECILGIRKYDSGEILILGHKVWGKLPPEISSSIGIHLEGSELHPWLTVEENLRVIAKTYGIEYDDDHLRHIVDLLGLKDILNRLYRNLSLGQKRRAEIASALLLKPKILILDEPMAQLDVIGRFRIMEILNKLHKVGYTIVYSTHHLEIAQRYSTRIGIINQGRMLFSGTTNELLSSFHTEWKLKVTFRGGKVDDRLIKTVDGYVYKTNELSSLLEVLRGLITNYSEELVYIEITQSGLEDIFKRLIVEGDYNEEGYISR